VAIYTVLVGAEASVVRAAIMAVIFIFATPFLGAFIGQTNIRSSRIIHRRHNNDLG
jgi:hypothetical protein